MNLFSGMWEPTKFGVDGAVSRYVKQLRGATIEFSAMEGQHMQIRSFCRMKQITYSSFC